MITGHLSTGGGSHQSVLLQQQVGLLLLSAVLDLHVLQPEHTHHPQTVSPPHTPPTAERAAAASPLLHLQLDVDALLLQQLPLGVVPVLWLPLLVGRGAALPLQPRLFRVVEAEHVVLPHDDPVT